MESYSSGRPRVHRDMESKRIAAAIAEYVHKLSALIRPGDREFFAGLIADLAEELAIRAEKNGGEQQ